MKIKGLTLLELLIAIGISAILGGTTVFMLRTSLDAYLFTEEEALIQKILSETLNELSGNSYNVPGIKDALEILEAREDSFSFVPLWVDDSHRVTSGKRRFILNRPFKPGAALPIAECEIPGEEHKFLSITFIPNEEPTKATLNDIVILNEPLKPNARLRFLFHPDATSFTDVVMKIKWDSNQGCFLRSYKNKTEKIPKYSYKGFKLTGARFQYFDNSNAEISTPVPEELIPNISAVRLSLSLTQGNSKAREAVVFINLRNSRAFGKGIVIHQGTRIKIPDSHNIRTFSLGNIIGVKQGDVIQLEAQPTRGKSWRITLELGIKDKLPIIKRYIIDYPPGATVYSETINQTLDLPLNFLTLGGNGRYDYDFDKDVDNIVNLKGDVVLSVEKMGPLGAAIFIRP